MKFRKLVYRQDPFVSRYFDDQISHKYLVELDDKASIETAGYEHFLGQRRVDLALDLSTMVGCPVGCRYCASASLDFFRNLSEDEIYGQATYLIRQHDVPGLKQITCSFQGIGEPSLLPKTIVSVGRRLLRFDSRIVLSLSTTCADLGGVQHLIESGLPFHNLQFTICGDSRDTAGVLMPTAPDPALVISAAVKYSQIETIAKMKINYLLVHGVNDAEENILSVASQLQSSSVVLKLSYLNKTNNSQKCKLMPSSRQTVDRLVLVAKNLGVDCYAFGAFADIGLSCGQLESSEEL